MVFPGTFPLPLSEFSQSDEFENVKKKLVEAMQTIEIREKNADELKLEFDKMKEENEKLKEKIQHQQRIYAENKKNEKEKSETLLTEQLLKVEQLEFYRSRTLVLVQDLEKVTREKVQSEAEKMEQIDKITAENRNLTEENTTLKMLNSEMTELIETLTMLRNELEVNLATASKTPEPEVVLENELEDTTCAICTEEMRLKKCTPCRRRFHKSCVENWLQNNNTCPTCRAAMN